MSLRRLLNTAYSAIAEGKSESELSRWDKALEAGSSPESTSRPASRGTGELMAVLGGLTMPSPSGPQRPRPALPEPGGATT